MAEKKHAINSIRDAAKVPPKRVSFPVLRPSFGVSQGGWLGLKSCWRRGGIEMGVI